MFSLSDEDLDSELENEDSLFLDFPFDEPINDFLTIDSEVENEDSLFLDFLCAEPLTFAEETPPGLSTKSTVTDSG